jgi:hypothetical protein
VYVSPLPFPRDVVVVVDTSKATVEKTAIVVCTEATRAVVGHRAAAILAAAILSACCCCHVDVQKDADAGGEAVPTQ